MIHIEVYRDSVLSFSVPFQGDSLSIGRSPSCDVCLPDPEVSRTHALIQRNKNSFSLVDKSVNGTALNGESVGQIDVLPGDQISIGPWMLTIQTSTTKDEKTVGLAQHEGTGILSYHEKNQELILTESCLEQIEPIQRTFRLKKNILTLGKNPGNDVVLQDDYVSSFHCKIEFRKDHFVIKDLQSRNGIFLNDQKIAEAYIHNLSTITIGRAKFNFHITQKPVQASTPKMIGNEFFGMISQDRQMKKIFGLIQSLEAVTSPVLIQGETGTGKELAAYAIHENSLRSGKPFVAINCGAIAKDLVESELFGHEKGAFTGALMQRQGVFEQAHQGTLFLDEIAELPLEFQTKLLRVLETGEIRRVGGSKNINVDVRIVAATHRDLQEETVQGKFREDLFYRIFVLPIQLPPLRHRSQDIPLLINHFLENHSKTLRKKFSPPALEKLMNHSWPGNIRELKHVIDRAIATSNGDLEVDEAAVQFAFTSTKERRVPMVDGFATLEDVEKRAILAALEKNHWNKKLTASKLGIAKSTLHEKVKKYKIDSL